MSLITRCPACGTMFKVVTDQLKVSQGWVRCGHCSEVFDASLHLQSAPEPVYAAPPTYQEPQPFNAPPAWAPYNEPAPAYVEQPVQPSVPDDASWSPGVFFPENNGFQPSPGHPVSPLADKAEDFDPVAWKKEHPSTQLDETGTLRLNEYGEAVRAHALDAQGLVSDPVRPEDSEDVLSEFPLEAANASDDVSFVRDARRKAMWRKPGVRIALGFLAMLLLTVLLLQVVVQQRDSVAAMEPRFKPWLQALCAQLQCEVAPLRRIESVVIDSSSFNKIDADSYRLSFSLKNTGTAQVAMPSLEVTLTDTQDQALVRRVLTPAQLGMAATVLGAGAEVAGAVAMQVNDTGTAAVSNGSAPASPLRVAGYRVLAFYP